MGASMAPRQMDLADLQGDQDLVATGLPMAFRDHHPWAVDLPTSGSALRAHHPQGQAGVSGKTGVEEEEASTEGVAAVVLPH